MLLVRRMMEFQRPSRISIGENHGTSRTNRSFKCERGLNVMGVRHSNSKTDTYFEDE